MKIKISDAIRDIPVVFHFFNVGDGASTCMKCTLKPKIL